MKKLLLILSAVFVSVMAWAQKNPDTGWDYLNPYAYDLKSEVINNGQTLHLTYKFNAPGFGNSDEYNKLNPKDGTGTGRGIQIYLLYKDEQGNWQRVQKDDNTGDYAIYSGGYNAAQEWSVNVNVIDIPKNCKGKELTWEAVVHGNIGRTTPKVVKASGTKPTNAYGIAVNNDPTHVRFAQMFVSEAFPSKREGWNYWKDRWGDNQSEYEYANTMLEYTPLLGFKYAHFKHYHNDTEKSHFASLWDWTNKYGDLTITSTYSYNYEPNRIKVSEDGRTFVSSFHPKASCVVLEYGKKRDEYNGHHFYNTIDNNWENNKDLDNISDKVDGNYNPFLYRRCVGMDVKGKGDNLKIILLWIDANAAKYTISGNTVPAAKFIIYEYELGLAEAEGYIATNKYLPPFDDTGCKYVHKIGEYSWDYQGWSSGGAFYQGARYGALNNNKRYLYNNMLRGFADLAYGTNDDVWVKIDYCAETAAKPKIIRVKLNNGTTTEYTINNGSTANYGGSGILIKDGMLITSPTNSTICLYEINANGELNATDKQPNAKHTIIDNQIGSWVTGFATDYAGNLFALTQASINGENYTANILGIAMPYKTKTAITTRAKGTFTLADPVPNIYAANLRYEAVEGAPKYKFSFNVNTKPKYAEIRFYKSYESMKESLSVVNADNFKGGKDNRGAELYCYYPIPNTQLKSGKIELEFGMVGGVIQNKLLTNQSLPRGELYWSVYVETDKSSAFAPIYRQSLTGTDAHYHMHAIVNDNPETDQFGAIYGAQEDKRGSTAKQSLMIYEISDNGSDVHNINNTTRYTKKQEYLYNTSDSVYNAKPRRMDIAPDGTLYIAHEGADNKNSADKVAAWQYGGIYAWNPNDPLKNGKLKLSKFSGNKIGTSSAVVLYGHVNNKDTTWKMYAANSYGEFTTHGNNYTNDNQRGKFGWNGFVEYEKAKATNWSSWLNVANANHEYQLKQGDGSGNSSLVAMDKGVWICQYREHSIAIKVAMNEVLADNRGSLVLSFVPYGNYTNADADWGPRTWRSSTTDGGRTRDENGNLTVKEDKDKSLLTQVDGALLQATPGGGMAYRKINGVDYLFINNHDGNIVQLQVDWDANSSPAKPLVHVSKAKVLTTPSDVKGILTINGDTQKNIRWKTAAVSSMSFDFAGNLVTTTGVSYFMLSVPQLLSGGQDKFNTPEGGQSIIVYTMPYDRTNAREIQAPKSNIFIPERLAQLNMTNKDIQAILTEHQEHGSQCYVDLYRPMQGGMYNTFCVPFQLKTTNIPTDHPLFKADIKRFVGVTLNDDLSGEKILTLNFDDLENNTMAANVPHIIKPTANVKSIIPFDWVLTLATDTIVNPLSEGFDGDNSITYQGILPKTWVEAVYEQNTNLPLRLILVADNRLAVLTGNGEMYGFRGYFDLAKPLPPGTVAKISAKKDTPTNTTIVVDGKKVNIDKYLREGRVYIRVGDSLYTVDGQLVK